MLAITEILLFMIYAFIYLFVCKAIQIVNAYFSSFTEEKDKHYLKYQYRQHYGT